MNRNWISRLGEYSLHVTRRMRSSLAALRSNDFYVDSGVDGPRMRSELNAIQSRYQDHS